LSLLKRKKLANLIVDPNPDPNRQPKYILTLRPKYCSQRGMSDGKKASTWKVRISLLSVVSRSVPKRRLGA